MLIKSYFWIASPASSLAGSQWRCGANSRHCERSEAIQNLVWIMQATIAYLCAIFLQVCRHNKTASWLVWSIYLGMLLHRLSKMVATKLLRQCCAAVKTVWFCFKSWVCYFRESLKTFPIRHCEVDSPKQSIENKSSGLLHSVRNDEKTEFVEIPKCFLIFIP